MKSDMKNLMLSAALASVTLAASSVAIAQEYNEEGFNPLSSKSIHKSDIMWKKSVLRRLDLREKQNLPLFATGNEISGLIMEAVKEGIITPYKNDSLKTKMTIDEFLENVTLPDYGDGDDAEEEEGFGDEDTDDGFGGGWGDEEEEEEEPAVEEVQEAAPGSGNYYFARDLYLMEIKEDLIFDKQRSRLYYDMIAFNFFLSADHPDNIKGIDIPLASFSYKELEEKLFKDNPAALWINPQNDSEHRNLADSFELRLFHGYIIKVSNPTDQFLIDVYGGSPETGIMASQWAAFELLEFEHNLWEF
jgi:hypothetical protein